MLYSSCIDVLQKQHVQNKRLMFYKFGKVGTHKLKNQNPNICVVFIYWVLNVPELGIFEIESYRRSKKRKV